MSNFNSGPNAQGQAAGPYMNAPGYDFGPRYGMGGMGAMAMPYAFMPAMAGVPPVAPYAHGGHGNAPANGYGDNDAVGLADGLQNSLVINPQQQMGGHMRGQYNQGHYGGPQQRGGASGYGYGYAPPAPGMRGGQQGMMQQHLGPPGNMGGPPQHMMNGHGPYGGPGGHQGSMGPGGPSRDGGRGRGRGPPGMQPQDHRQQQPPQQQRRKKVQRGLEENVKRTVYISYIDQQVTEESLATFFADCGTVMDCRICGDPNSAMRFAFIEFLEEAGAQEALNKTGQHLGTSQLRVLPSKTAIVPVNKELMPRSHEELERCSRTVYVANIDKKVEREDVRNFFEHLCGKVGKIRLLGDLAHSTRIAFIEFIQAESAMAALNCSGALLGSLPLRVSPSKTPVRGDREDKESRGGRGQRPKSANAAAAQKEQAAAAAAASDTNGEQQQEQQQGANGAAATAADDDEEQQQQEQEQQESDGAEEAAAAATVEGEGNGGQSADTQDAAAAAAAAEAEAEPSAGQAEVAAAVEHEAAAGASDAAAAEEIAVAIEPAAA